MIREFQVRKEIARASQTTADEEKTKSKRETTEKTEPLPNLGAGVDERQMF